MSTMPIDSLLHYFTSGDGLAFDLTKDGVKYLIGGVASAVAIIGRRRWRTRRALAFWRPFIKSNTAIVIGTFPGGRDFDRAGLMGFGDAAALGELERSLALLGLHSPEILYASQVHGDDLNRPLITLGGPDANQVTRMAVERMVTRLRFGDPDLNEITITDTVNGHSYSPGGSDDYGAIIRARNPFAPKFEMIIIAGSFGHGTWAGARFATSPEFLTNSAVKKFKSTTPAETFECLVMTDVVCDTPQNIHPVVGPEKHPLRTS